MPTHNRADPPIILTAERANNPTVRTGLKRFVKLWETGWDIESEDRL